jgi:GNAT superfamily N-acetyltransferase
MPRRRAGLPLAPVVLPVTAAGWDDFARLFEARGSPHYCWCSPYRFADAHEMDGGQKRAAMRRLVDGGTPVGVLAYDRRGGTPIGWCSIAPRESYVKLRRSRTMPRKTDEATPTWTVLCFFVTRPLRGGGVARALLAGAVKYARARGARVIEGYPHDSAGISATHRGHSSLFAAAGFRADGARWVLQTRPRARRA